MRKTKLLAVSLSVMLVGASTISNASSLMDAKLNASFHVVPVLQDTATGTTYYGTNTYHETAVAYVKVKAYKSDGSYNSTGDIIRYGWDAVSGEGDKGPCKGTAKIRAMTKAVSTHKGKKYDTSSKWTETKTLKVTNPN